MSRVVLLVLFLAVGGRALGAAELPISALRPARQLSAEERAELKRQLDEHARVLEAQAAVVKAVARLIGPSVVHIEAEIRPAVPPEFGRARRVEEAGSGVIVQLGRGFYVLTNRHVVRGAAPEDIKINLADGRRIYPKKVWGDPDTDIAVLAIDAPGLQPAELGDSDRMEIGDFVLAVGSPFGLSQSVTFGIVSAKGRRDLQLGQADVRFQDFMQTDAAINPGNSGGPLVNLRGQVIGINTAIASNSGGNEGIGFSIPVNMFMIVARQLVETGKVSRAFLGVNLNSKFGPATAAEAGLPYVIGTQVTGVTKGSPAEAARLQTGDIILQFDGLPIEDDAHLVNLVSLTTVGKKVPVLIYRDRKTLVIEVVVGDRAQFEAPR
jgi:serine protease Do